MTYNIEEAKKIMTPADISGRLIHTTSSGTLKNKDTNAYWKVSFEEGVDPLDDSALPNFGDENHDFLGLKLDHTQWRYDFGFITPSCMFTHILYSKAQYFYIMSFFYKNKKLYFFHMKEHLKIDHFYAPFVQIFIEIFRLKTMSLHWFLLN
jgi:hypothetical protein